MINESLTVELERYKEQIKIFKERQQFDLNDREKYIDGQLRKVIIDQNANVAGFENQIHSLKQLNKTVESHKTLSTTADLLKIESKAKKDKTCYQNPLYLSQARRKVHALYCGNTIVKQHAALSVIDTEETLELAEESRLKMHAKQNDPIIQEKKVNIAPIDYVALNKLSEHFVKHFLKIVLIKEKELLLENECLLELLLSQDLVHTAENSLAEIIDYQSMEKSFLNEYSECVELKAELSKKNEMVEKVVYDELSKQCARLENRLISFTSASGSKPPSNTKKNRILRPKSSNQKNKVEDHLRSVNSSPNKKNRVSKPVFNVNVKHSVSNVNYELICATCNECMFDAIHDLCVLNYVNDVNVRVKSKSVKSKKKKVWKPTRKVFTNVGYSWKPIGRIFTIDGYKFPLNRINSTTVVPPRIPTLTKVVKKTQPSSNNSGKLKNITNIDSSSKSKSVESKISNNSEPNKNWGSNVSTSPSFSRVYFRSFKSSFGIWTQVAPST
ncbi:hypothetical protein Tco_1256840 [Tanacetum coccineum]